MCLSTKCRCIGSTVVSFDKTCSRSSPAVTLVGVVGTPSCSGVFTSLILSPAVKL